MTIAAGLRIILTLEENGYSAFFIGGMVRDTILQRPYRDIDIVTNAPVEEVERIFPTTIALGKVHGTLIVRNNGQNFEVSSFRDGNALIDDLSLRDFTMNAIAMNKELRIIDPLGGREDILAGQIRAVGHPQKRFAEDPLRIIRAIRFVSELGFAIEEETKKQIPLIAPSIKQLAIERVVTEWEKILQGSYLDKALEEMVQLKLYEYVPFLKKEALTALLSLGIKERLSKIEWLTIMCLVMKIDNPIPYLNSIMQSNEVKEKVAFLMEILKERERTNWNVTLLYKAGDARSSVERIARIVGIQGIIWQEDDLLEEWRRLPIKKRSDLAINGHDLQTCFLKGPGSWIKTSLEKVETAVLLRVIPNNKEKILTWLKEGGQDA